MEKRPLFTIIMPVYNTEIFLNEAVESIINQTFKDFELLLINDCSTDNSLNICNDFANRNEKIKVIDLLQNSGLSNVRNIGIKNASGRYICFIDSDDTIELDLLQKTYETMNSKSPKAIMFGFIEDYFDIEGSISSSYNVVYPKKALDNKDELRKEIINIEKSTLFGYSSNKFYDLDYIKSINLNFENVRLIEDFEFNLNFFKDADSLYITDFAGYHYNKRVNSNSLTGSFVSEYFDVHRRRVLEMLEQYKEWDLCSDYVKSTLANIYIRYIFSALQRNCDKRSNMNYTDRKEWLQNLFNDELFKELINFATPDSQTVKIMSKFLKNKRLNITLFIGKFIYIVKCTMPIFFAKLKQKK